MEDVDPYTPDFLKDGGDFSPWKHTGMLPKLNKSQGKFIK